MSQTIELSVERDGMRRRVLIDCEDAVVGRGRDCALRLDDPLMSREHCRLERLGKDLFVVDLDSANGTWFKGERITRQQLSPGERFRVGSSTIEWLLPTPVDRLASAEQTHTQISSPNDDRLTVVADALQGMAQESRSQQMAELTIDAAVTLSKAERGFLFLVEGERTTLAVGRNFAREEVPHPEQKLSRTFFEKALRSNEPILLNDAAESGDFAGVTSISDLGLRSLFGLPLRRGDDLYGLLVVDHRMARAAFADADDHLLRGLANAAACAFAAVAERKARRRLERNLRDLKRRAGQKVPRTRTTVEGMRFEGIVGSSPSMERLFDAMERVLDSEVTVLVRGESGVGKELVARALHRGGPRRQSAFVPVNCGALPDTLLESELFGHEKGAFTGAHRGRVGRFEEADGGTLFLDEVGEMSLEMQKRLLRAIEHGEIRPLGSEDVVQVDVRLVAASNADLERAVEDGTFREDLYYRLKVVTLDVPPLRDRKGDFPLLVEHLLQHEATHLDRQPRTVDKEVMERLCEYPWPGNIRELGNELRRLTLMGEGGVELHELGGEIVNPANLRGSSLQERVTHFEREAIRHAIAEAGGNKTHAAEALGITRYTLLRKIDKHGMDV